MTPEHHSISVIYPVGHALERVKTILFKPFDLNKWFIMGFCAWLAYLGRGGFNFSFPPGYNRPGFQPFQQAKDFVAANVLWIIPTAVIAVVLIITLWLAVIWLSSRGRFMFLYCVAQNKAEVKIPWTKFQQHANSLFLFRIVLSIICFLAAALFSLPAFFLIVALKTNAALNVALIIALVLNVLIFISFFLVFLLVHKFTTDFVVPIMFLRTTSCITAWREFLQLLSAQKAAFVLYILFQIVITMAIGAILMAATLVTCCCAACILWIPYIGTVLMLPVLVFKRAYSLFYFQQFGPAFDLWSIKLPADSL